MIIVLTSEIATDAQVVFVIRRKHHTGRQLRKSEPGIQNALIFLLHVFVFRKLFGQCSAVDHLPAMRVKGDPNVWSDVRPADFHFTFSWG